MVTRRNTALAFIAILIATGLVVFFTQVEAQTIDEQKQALIGEWEGVWAGMMRSSSILMIHEIDTINAKARCTLISPEAGGRKNPVLADFIPGSNPKIEFKIVGNDYKFVLKGKVLEGTFRGMSPTGYYLSNAIKMGKKPEK